MTMKAILFGLLTVFAVPGQSFPFGPKYPITASWFRDRFTYAEWNRTLAEFQEQGGDTVFLRAPPIIKRTREDLQRDQDFIWCGSSHSSTGVLGTPCYDEAVTELESFGLNVTAFVTYKYEEGFSDAIMMCPRVDRKINSSRIYYRIVLPAGHFNESNPCFYPSGTDVVVLFTSFAGTDPHSLLMSAATDRNMSVYFGLPSAPSAYDAHRDTSHWTGWRRGRGQGLGAFFDESLMGAYYGWVYRVLNEHRVRYSNMKVKVKVPSRSRRSPRSRLSKPSVYNKTLAGYYSTDECCLAQVDSSSPFVSLYTRLGQMVHEQDGKKKLAVSPFIDLNRSQLNATVQQHVQGFEAIAATGQVDVIAVQEGRGAGKGCYYWPNQKQLPVKMADKTLDRILHYLDPNLKENVTFEEACSASNQEVFAAFERSHDSMQGKKGVSFEFWLNVEAFEYLRDDPCLPVDPAASGMGELLNRASKARVDRALSVASAKVQKVISFAWDSDFTCTTRQYKSSLAASIRATANSPIIANCSFHSPANMSVVVIGYNLEGETQSFQVNWPTRDRKRQTSSLHGYYFELDWGVQHNRIASLQYTQLYDLPGVLLNLADKGWVSVKAGGAANTCVFEYDFSRSARARRSALARHFHSQ